MSSDRSTARHAMTLVELLVVVAIIAVLMGLSLPAVQRIRESANQTTCRNNLKQIGIALHSYHAAKGSLPPAYHCETLNLEFVEFCSPGWGWAAYLLPFLDHGPLAESCKWDLTVEDAANAHPRTVIVKTFTCPSDVNTGVYNVLTEYNQKIAQAATNSYAACYGSGVSIGESASSGNGIFYCNSKTRWPDIRDGTSTTLAIGERAAWFCQSPWIGAISRGTVRTSLNSPTLLAAIEEAPVMVMARTYTGQLNNPYSQPYDFFTPHPAAGLFLFADGSVRSLAFSMNSSVWQAIATRNGGETVAESDF